MSSQSLAVTRRKLSISLAVGVFLVAIFSVNRVALPNASPTAVAPRPAVATPAVTGQTRTINLNSGYEQWSASPTLINVFGKDNEWRVISDTVNGAPQPPPATGRPADVVPDSSWNLNPLLATNFPNSRWISVTPLQGQPLPTPPPTNKFQYAYYFTLPDGFTNPVLTMKLLADDQIAKVTLNSTILFQGAGGRFYNDPLVLPSSALTSANFNSGSTVNVITVEVEDTFAGSTGLIVDGQVTYEDCDRLPIRQIPGLTSISFWESTFAAPTSSTFAASGSELTTRLSGSLKTGNSDFESLPGFESYDISYSDWNGVPNPNGQFVTIEAETKGPGAPSGGALNIARVDFNGTGKSASSVASFVALGNNAMPNDIGKAVDVDPNALTDTTMGNTNGQSQRLRVTVGFPCACVAPPPGMVAWWPLDGLNAEGEYEDLAGGDSNGEPIGNPSAIANQYVGNALQAGIGKYVEVTDAPNLNFGQESFSIDAWVKFTPGTLGEPIVYKLPNPNGTGGGYFLHLETTPGGTLGRLSLKISTHIFQGPLFTAPIGTWIFVAATVNKTTASTGTVNFFVGVPGGALAVATKPAGAFSASSPGTSLQIGHWEGDPLAGLGIDEVEIFNRALAASEIQEIFAAGSAGKCKPTPGRGTLIIKKNTVGGDDKFGYTSTGDGLSPFTITTSGGTGTQTFSNVAPGPKTVTETSPPSGWAFTNLVCSDPDSGTTFSGQTANIDLDPNETVSCTYTNTKCPDITLSPAAGALPAPIPNTSYFRTFTATGGCSQSFTYSVTHGALPPGLTLGSNGVLSGFATQVGEFPFTVTATDSCGCSKSQSYTLRVDSIVGVLDGDGIFGLELLSDGFAATYALNQRTVFTELHRQGNRSLVTVREASLGEIVKMEIPPESPVFLSEEVFNQSGTFVVADGFRGATLRDQILVVAILQRSSRMIVTQLEDKVPGAILVSIPALPKFLGIQREGEGTGNTNANTRIAVGPNDGVCHGACGIGCDWCLCTTGRWCICWVTLFCYVHDSCCGAGWDFFKCFPCDFQPWWGAIRSTDGADDPYGPRSVLPRSTFAQGCTKRYGRSDRGAFLLNIMKGTVE